jgi:hypothetical protein
MIETRGPWAAALRAGNRKYRSASGKVASQEMRADALTHAGRNGMGKDLSHVTGQ